MKRKINRKLTSREEWRTVEGTLFECGWYAGFECCYLVWKHRDKEVGTSLTPEEETRVRKVAKRFFENFITWHDLEPSVYYELGICPNHAHLRRKTVPGRTCCATCLKKLTTKLLHGDFEETQSIPLSLPPDFGRHTVKGKARQQDPSGKR
jgi:hypothetical protein